MNKTIILTGGGTAGHVMVNINLENELKKHFSKIIYLGSENGIEKSLIKSKTSYDFISIPTVKFERKKILKSILIPFKLLSCVSKTKQILKSIKPDVIFSKGGYVGLPVVIAGKKLKIKTICHESDITMGLANKIAKNYANTICTNFEITAQKNGKKCVHTSMPLPLSNLSKIQAKEKLKIPTSKPCLLVTGGSLGARSINEFIFKNLNKLTEKFYVVHLVGNGNLNKNLSNNSYRQIEFENDMWTLLKATDFAISRAGANTIVELLANEILTIFIPLPSTVSRGDQIENAKYLAEKNLAKFILQEDLNLKKLQNLLNLIEKDSKNIKNNIKNANFKDGTKKIINLILN